MPTVDWEGAEQVWGTSFEEQESGINASSSKLPSEWLALPLFRYRVVHLLRGVAPSYDTVSRSALKVRDSCEKAGHSGDFSFNVLCIQVWQVMLLLNLCYHTQGTEVPSGCIIISGHSAKGTTRRYLLGWTGKMFLMRRSFCK